MPVEFDRIILSCPAFKGIASFDLFCDTNHNANSPKTTNKENTPKDAEFRGMLIYGKNGAGKSTIAKAFRKATGEYVPSIEAVTIKNSNGVVLSSEELRDIIHVFDEDYIEKNIRLRENDLKTIAILGESIELADKIESLQKERNETTKKKEEILKAINKHENKNDKTSLNYTYNKILSTLKGNDGWADRYRKIENSKKNRDVKDQIITNIANLKLTKEENLVQLTSEFSTKLNELNNLRSGTSLIERAAPKLAVNYLSYPDDSANELLAKTIEKPELSEREKKILEMATKQPTQELREKLKFFEEGSNKRCPYCFQELQEEYKDFLVDGIQKILNQTVQNHINELEKAHLEQTKFDLTPFESLDEYENCTSQIRDLESEIEKLNNSLKQKEENPYKPIKDAEINVSAKAKLLSDSLHKLELQRLEHNKPDNKIIELRKKLLDINDKIAHQEIINYYEEFLIRKEDKNHKERELEETESKLKTLSENIMALEALKKNTKIAVEEINESLRFIFYDQNRLQIRSKGDSYTVTVRGQNTTPSRISTGERNAIALCYFFTSILEGQEKESAYKKQHLLIIDDPLSSFDRDNQIGITSYLGEQIKKFMLGNSNTRIIVLTHSFKGYLDLYKTVKTIKIRTSETNKKVKPFQFLELRNTHLESINPNKRQEYSELLKIILSYAKEINDDYTPVIGNIMRQALEAFSTFTYRKGIIDLCSDQKITSALPDSVITYYKKLMYQLVLHDCSHREGQVATLQDMNFSDWLSDDEKQRTAQEIICLLYFFNKNHVLQHLDGINDAETTIDNWCKAIQQRCRMQ